MNSVIIPTLLIAFGLPGYLEWLVLVVVVCLLAIALLRRRHVPERKTNSNSQTASEAQQVTAKPARDPINTQHASESRSFSWFWPSSKGGVAAFTVVLTLSALTVLIDPLLFWINVFVWYAVAVAVRAVYLKLSA